MLLTNGRPKKLLLEGQILAAQEISKSEAQVAEKLGVSYMTYRKYANMYGIYGRVSNKAGIGIDKSIKNEDTGKYPLNQILDGKFPDYDSNRLKTRMLRGKRIEQKCNKCGLVEKRISDGTTPLLMNFLDGNEKNKKRENIELLCYNCYYLYVNNPFGCRKKFVVAESDKANPILAPTAILPETAAEVMNTNEVVLTDEEKQQIMAEIPPSQ